MSACRSCSDVNTGRIYENLQIKNSWPSIVASRHAWLVEGFGGPHLWCCEQMSASTVRTSNPGNQCAWTKVAICRSGDREPTWLSQLPWTVTLSHCHGIRHASEFDLSLPRSPLQDFKTWLGDRAWVSWALHTVVNLVPLFRVRNSDFGYFWCSIVSKCRFQNAALRSKGC